MPPLILLPRRNLDALPIPNAPILQDLKSSGKPAFMFAAFALPAAILAQGVVSAADFKDPGYNKLVWVDSPNFNVRPKDVVVDTIVLHHTAGPDLVGCVRWFVNPESKVSAHFVIGKDGSIVQQVSTFDRAWHAGVSKDKLGREGVNNFSVGIEMVNVGDGKDPWTKEQVEVVHFLCAHLMKRFPIKYIVSHEYIAEPRGRKPDPKGFPWDTLKDLGLELIYGLKPIG